MLLRVFIAIRNPDSEDALYPVGPSVQKYAARCRSFHLKIERKDIMNITERRKPDVCFCELKPPAATCHQTENVIPRTTVSIQRHVSCSLLMSAKWKQQKPTIGFYGAGTMIAETWGFMHRRCIRNRRLELLEFQLNPDSISTAPLQIRLYYTPLQ